MSTGGGSTRQEVLYPHGQPERGKKRTPKALSKRQALADLLHQHLCQAASHETDGDCPWYLFTWEYPDELHRRYLKRADALLKVLGGDGNLAYAVIEAITVTV